MTDIIVKKEKVTVNLEWKYSNDEELLDAIKNAQELTGLIDKDEQDKQDSQT